MATGLPDQVADLTEQYDICLHELRAARHQIEAYAAYCQQNRLAVDAPVLARLADDAGFAGLRIGRQRRALQARSPAYAADLLTSSEAVLRFGLATLAYVRNALEWCAASYAQSGSVQFFDTGAQGSPLMNYDRNGTQAGVRRVERQLLEVLDFPAEQYGLSVTSSGMAAFTVVESFLVRDRLRPGDTVLLAPYTYYEATEQLTALPFVTVERAAGWSVQEIVADVLRLRPRVLSVDPIANTARQRMIDLPGLFARLRKVLSQPLTVVVDGTMLPATMPVELMAGDEHLEVVYYESCTKYAQLGMDASMAGLVAYPIALQERFDQLRRNAGAVLFRHNAELFPRYRREFLRRRMRRICANATRLAALLDADPRVTAVASVHHPALSRHPDRGIADTLPYASGIVTFLYHDTARNSYEELDRMADVLVRNTVELGVEFTKGVSFGYSVPRVWIQVIGGVEPHFARISVGDRSHQLEPLAEAIARAVIAEVTPSDGVIAA
jgi:cystathionine gamma-synthase